MRRIIGHVLSMLGWSEVRKPYLPVCEVARPTEPIVPPPLPFWYSERHQRCEIVGFRERFLDKWSEVRVPYFPVQRHAVAFVQEARKRPKVWRKLSLLIGPLRRHGVIHV